jgi:hypothetical protein
MGIRKLSSRFIGYASARVTIAAMAKFIRRLSGKNILKMIAVLMKKAVLPSRDFFKNLCFPKGIPTRAASVSEIDSMSKAGTAISFGNRKMATTEPVKT